MLRKLLETKICALVSRWEAVAGGWWAVASSISCGDTTSGPAAERDVPVSAGPPGSVQHPGSEGAGERTQPVFASGHEMYVDLSQTHTHTHTHTETHTHIHKYPHINGLHLAFLNVWSESLAPCDNCFSTVLSLSSTECFSGGDWLQTEGARRTEVQAARGQRAAERHR